MEALSHRYGWKPSEIKKEAFIDLAHYLKIIDLENRLKKKYLDKNKKSK